MAADPKKGSDEKLQQIQIADLQKLAVLSGHKVSFAKNKPKEQEPAEDSLEQKDQKQQRLSSTALLYFYHPDHLGTSTFLTDYNGNAYQFFLNLPFGETMAEQKSITEDYATPYKFNGKELDEETGLYYYGARYYDSKISIWLSVDPLAEKFPNWNPYNYTMQNPINLIDPDGRGPSDPPSKGRVANVIQVKSYIKGTNTPASYKFTPAAVNLLSLVSGVDKKSIQSTTLTFKNYGGGAMTTGEDSKHGNITYYNVSAKSFSFLELSAHEVGHLPQLDDYGGGSHIARSVGAYIVSAIININAINDEDYGTIVHDSSPLEQQAEVGSGIYRDFSKFVDDHYGNGKEGMIRRLFNNKANTDDDIISRINKWWKAYKTEKYEKIDYSDVPDS
jgi:RHS repeat-associated protein